MGPHGADNSHPDGLRGNNNNIIQVGLYESPGTPYGAGTRYYCSTATMGELTTSPNDYFAAHGITTSQLLVNIIGTANWGDAQTIYDVEHDSSTGVHSLGSCRTFVGLASEAGAATSGGLASSTGMTLFATDTKQVFHCTDGSSNTWEEVSQFSGPLEITSTLEVGGNLILPTGTIDDAAIPTQSMDVFSHAGRHASVSAIDDPIPGLIRQLSVDASTSLSAELTGFQEILSVSVDFSGRGGNSTVLLFAHSAFYCTNVETRITMRLLMDGTEITFPYSVRAINSQANENYQEWMTLTLQGYDDTVDNTGIHTFTVEAVKASGTAYASYRQLMLLDLGPN